MTTARLFKNGRSQAVRIPKEMEIQATEVELVRTGNGIFIYPHTKGDWSNVREVAEKPGAYPAEIPAPDPQERDLAW